MKITVESTGKKVELPAGFARQWKGTTARGVHFDLYVSTIAVACESPADLEEFRDILELPADCPGCKAAQLASEKPAIAAATAPQADGDGPALEHRINLVLDPAEAFLNGALYAIGLAMVPGEPPTTKFVAHVRAFFATPEGAAARASLVKKLNYVNAAVEASGFTRPAGLGK